MEHSVRLVWDLIGLAGTDRGWRALLLRRLLERVRRARVIGERRAFGEIAVSDWQLIIWPSVAFGRQVHVKRFGFKCSVKSKLYLRWLDREIIYSLEPEGRRTRTYSVFFCFVVFNLVDISVWIMQWLLNAIFETSACWSLSRAIHVAILAPLEHLRT